MREGRAEGDIYMSDIGCTPEGAGVRGTKAPEIIPKNLTPVKIARVRGNLEKVIRGDFDIPAVEEVGGYDTVRYGWLAKFILKIPTDCEEYREDIVTVWVCSEYVVKFVVGDAEEPDRVRVYKTRGVVRLPIKTTKDGKYIEEEYIVRRGGRVIHPLIRVNNEYIYLMEDLENAEVIKMKYGGEKR